MEKGEVSIDEFLNDRKAYVKAAQTGGDMVVKGGGTGVSSYDAEAGTARFTMSAEVEDHDRDIVIQSGIGMDVFNKNPVAFLAHMSWDLPVGQWKDVAQALNGRPKRTEGTLVLTKGDPVADRLGLHLAAGSLRACSIGFVPKSVRRRDVPEDKKDQGYYYPGYEILECTLVECSPCGVPANPLALAKAKETGDTVLAVEFVEEVLDKWVKHPESGLIVPRAELEQSWLLLKGAAGAKPDEKTGGLLSRLFKAFGDGGVIAKLESQARADQIDEEAAERAARDQELAEAMALAGRKAAAAKKFGEIEARHTPAS